MSSSWSCETELREIAEELHRKAYELEQAADVLETLRESSDQEERIKKAKEWAKGWMK
jgi:hypothetical protein